MLTIGEFSNICKVSTKTLRYYEIRFGLQKMQLDVWTRRKITCLNMTSLQRSLKNMAPLIRSEERRVGKECGS